MPASSLIQEISAIVGDKWVLTKPTDLYLYSFDSALDRSLPSFVVLPGTPDEVMNVVKVLHKHKKSFVARGAATSLCGGPVPLGGAAVVGLTRLKKIGKLDKLRQEIWVEPGVVNLKLHQAVASEGLFYAPDPGSQKACTIGGNVATNAGGPHCLKYGVTSHVVTGIEVVLPDGSRTQFKVDDEGYDLTGFFVGSEGTLGLATRVRLKLLKKPKFIRTMLVSFNSMEEAIQSVTDIIAGGVLPATLEAMDKTTVSAVEAFIKAGYPTDAEAVLLIEVDGNDEPELDSEVFQIQRFCEANHSLEFRFAKDEADRQKLWEGRRGSYAAMARLAPNVLVEDGAVPRTQLPEALRRIKEIAQNAGLRVALLFHAGDGNLHPQIIFDERDEKHTKIVKDAGHKMLKVCVDLGGTISGEHGIGIDKREAMKWLFTRDTLVLFRRLKNVFDPENLCNPDKLIPLTSKTEAAANGKDPEQVLQTEGGIKPASEEDLIQTVKQLGRHKTHFGIQGSGSRFQVAENLVISTVNLNKILDFDKSNLTVTVQAGMPLEQLRSELEKEGRFLWVAGSGTVGGVIASRGSAEPPLRNLILGMKLMLPTGEVADLGAKTMKNVAGYDVPKLLIGSWGTLGVILQVTFRLFATPCKLLKAAPTKPFVMQDIHKRIKKAFDPYTQVAPRFLTYTQKDIQVKTEKQAAPDMEADKLKNIGDKFWL